MCSFFYILSSFNPNFSAWDDVSADVYGNSVDNLKLFDVSGIFSGLFLIAFFLILKASCGIIILHACDKAGWLTPERFKLFNTIIILLVFSVMLILLVSLSLDTGSFYCLCDDGSTTVTSNSSRVDLTPGTVTVVSTGAIVREPWWRIGDSRAFFPVEGRYNFYDFRFSGVVTINNDHTSIYCYNHQNISSVQLRCEYVNRSYIKYALIDLRSDQILIFIKTNGIFYPQVNTFSDWPLYIPR